MFCSLSKLFKPLVLVRLQISLSVLKPIYTHTSIHTTSAHIHISIDCCICFFPKDKCTWVRSLHMQVVSLRSQLVELAQDSPPELTEAVISFITLDATSIVIVSLLLGFLREILDSHSCCSWSSNISAELFQSDNEIKLSRVSGFIINPMWQPMQIM